MLRREFDKSAAWAIVIAQAKRFDVTHVALLGKSRRRGATFARFAAAALIRKELKLSYPQLGEYFNGRDHSTMMQMVKRAKQLNLVPPDGEPCSEIAPHCEGRAA